MKIFYSTSRSVSLSVLHETHERHVRHEKTYLTFKNEFENFEVYKIGFLIRVMLATNVYAKPEKMVHHIWRIHGKSLDRRREKMLRKHIKNVHKE